LRALRGRPSGEVFQQPARQRYILLALLIGAIVSAVILSPPVYSRIFGYGSAEECAVHTSNRFAYGACYDLYPSIKDKPTSSPVIAPPAQTSQPTQSAQVSPNSSSSLSAEDFSDTPPVLTTPPHGSVHWYGSPQVGAVPFEINTSAESNYYVKLIDAATGFHVLGIFVEGGKPLSTEVPPGRYVVKYASGLRWYGYDNYFGNGTAYSKATSTFNFEVNSDGANGYSITLYRVKNGNLRTSRITKAEF
jgi:hypothetical protein